MSVLLAAAAEADDYDDYDGDTDEGYDTQQSQSQASSLGIGFSLLPTATTESQRPSASPEPVQLPEANTLPPPPTIAITWENASVPAASYNGTNTHFAVEPRIQPPPPPSHLSTEVLQEQEDQPPLFLPEGVSSISELHEKVKKLFPDFKPDTNLRFLSMLGPGRKSSYPRIWQGARKRKKKTLEPPADGDEEEMKAGPDNWTFNFGPKPTPDMCMSDDEEKFLASVDSNMQSAGGGREVCVEVDKEISEWRFGPARVWYDMISVPEDGRGFDYGFKVKVRMMMYLCGCVRGEMWVCERGGCACVRGERIWVCEREGGVWVCEGENVGALHLCSFFL